MRAELIDECLDIVTGLWDGQPFSYDGKHYTIEPTEFPTIGHVVQQPRVPIWCVGALGTAEVDGAGAALGRPAPAGRRRRRRPPADARRRSTAIRERASATATYDIVIEGAGSEHSPAAWADAGATWWIESMWDAMREIDPVLAANDRLDPGPAARDGRTPTSSPDGGTVRQTRHRD